MCMQAEGGGGGGGRRGEEEEGKPGQRSSDEFRANEEKRTIQRAENVYSRMPQPNRAIQVEPGRWEEHNYRFLVVFL